ncbi:helix-hairpin-helix domain-containing protein [Geoalkalibacter subterraneus]|uniref:DNA ligase (NAD(+)) n=1 Tax=Geoalkalibacter subterraneus TaxID=483547 RepID=A0A0B5FJ01_9BACT|nr:helix-hairpin-helix domain-containing protein [Geoalkalibacter subterraneus]AJF08167.1 hypothetical protein GSUB_16835 [Geoalkalibacter subterraneus]
MDLFDSKDTLIEEANKAYNQGNPVLTDPEFDLLAETGLKVDTRNFRTKVAHPFPMGSLSKIKDAESLSKWAKGATGTIIGPKVDGAAVRLSYRDGRLVQVATRGDGVTGNDITGNARNCVVSETLPYPLTLEIRCEAVIRKCHADKFEKNLRNVVSGMLGAKDPRPELALVEFLAIEIVSEDPLTLAAKRDLLREICMKELTVPSVIYDQAPSFDEIEELFNSWKQNFPWAIDGVVVEKFHDLHAMVEKETELLPKHKVAVKFGNEAAVTVIEEIDWKLGQHGKLTPVLQIRPVEIDGTTVSKVSASNYALLKSAGLGVGAEVGVVKSGDIIPYVKEVHTPSQEGLDIPSCPSCDTQATLSSTGIDALCSNPECEGATLVRLQRQFDLFGIDFISGSTIEALVAAGHDSLEKIFSLSESDIAALDGFGRKSAHYIVTSLHKIEVTEAKVIKSAFLKGIGERKGTALLNHYGNLDTMIATIKEQGMTSIEGFGPIQTDLLNTQIGLIETQLQLYRSLGIKVAPHTAPAKDAKTVCCTGSCPGKSRKELKEVLAEMGFVMASSVTKDCCLLLCDDPEGNSSKLTKARKLGIEIKSYEDFFENQ